MSRDYGEGSSADPPTRKPTLKQTRFADAYLDPQGAAGNATAAAKLAGYRGSSTQLGVQGFRNVRNPTVQQLIRTKLEDLAGPALQRLGEALDATRTRTFLGKDGQVIYTNPEPDYKTRMTAVDFVLNRLSTGVETEAPLERRPESKVVQPCAQEDERAQEPGVLATLDPSDRANFIKVVEIENELAHLDRQLEEGDQVSETRGKSQS